MTLSQTWQGGQIRPKVGQTDTKWNKSAIFQDQFLVHFDSPSLKSPGVVQLRANLTNFWPKSDITESLQDFQISSESQIGSN